MRDEEGGGASTRDGRAGVGDCSTRANPMGRAECSTPSQAEGANAGDERRTTAGVVRSQLPLGVLSPVRHAPRGLGRSLPSTCSAPTRRPRFIHSLCLFSTLTNTNFIAPSIILSEAQYLLRRPYPSLDFVPAMQSSQRRYLELLVLGWFRSAPCLCPAMVL